MDGGFWMELDGIGWKGTKVDELVLKRITRMKVDKSEWKYLRCYMQIWIFWDSLMPFLMILISMTMMMITVSFHKSWVVSFPCGKLCPNQRWPSCRSPECSFADNSKSFLSSFSLSLSPLSWSPPESQWLTLQVLLCCRCLGFAPHPRIVDDPWSNVSAIGTSIVTLLSFWLWLWKPLKAAALEAKGVGGWCKEGEEAQRRNFLHFSGKFGNFCGEKME